MMRRYSAIAAQKFEDLMNPGEDRHGAFRRLVKEWHPDTHPGNAAVCNEIIARIIALYEPKKAVPATLGTVGKWILTESLASGAIADLYWTADGSVFKLASSPADNDLIDAEKLALRNLQSNDHFAKYAPKLLEAISVSGRRANVLQCTREGFSLEEILRKVPDMDFRHVVWMMNRGLSILGYAHRTGFVHGAVVPSHLLYEPAQHGLQLIDWCYSVAIGSPLKAVDATYKHLYAPEVLLKEPVSAGSDLYILGKSFQTSAKHIPARFKGVFEWVCAKEPNARPQDAWKLQDIWRNLAREEYGKAKFIDFVLPDRV